MPRKMKQVVKGFQGLKETLFRGSLRAAAGRSSLGGAHTLRYRGIPLRFRETRYITLVFQSDSCILIPSMCVTLDCVVCRMRPSQILTMGSRCTRGWGAVAGGG